MEGRVCGIWPLGRPTPFTQMVFQLLGDFTDAAMIYKTAPA